MKKLLILLLLCSGYVQAQQTYTSLPELNTTVAANTASIALKAPISTSSTSTTVGSVQMTTGIKAPATYVTSTTSWSSTVYNSLVEAKTLPVDQVYILTVYIVVSGQEFTTQLYYIGINQKNNSHSESADLTPFLVYQTSGTTNQAIKVRYRKPPNAFDQGMWGIEATIVSSTWQDGVLSWSLIPFLKVPH